MEFVSVGQAASGTSEQFLIKLLVFFSAGLPKAGNRQKCGACGLEVLLWPALQRQNAQAEQT